MREHTAGALSPTLAGRSNSRRAQLQRRIAEFLASAPTTAGWTSTGFQTDLDLLGRVLAFTDPADVRGGSVAVGLDFWAAFILRQGGLKGVRPNASEPFYVPDPSTSGLDQFSKLDSEINKMEHLYSELSVLAPRHGKTVQGIRRRLTASLKQLRKAVERKTTGVLGESRRKQVDVFLADWDRGLELLISTKTFALEASADALVKNLPNRWEEFDGDLKNLRGRFPLAVIGALTVLPAIAIKGALPAFVDMMTKLTAPGRPWVNAYDKTAIVIADWENRTGDRVPILNDQLTDAQLPGQLQPSGFFDLLFARLFERAPVSEHIEARIAANTAGGLETADLVNAADAMESAETDED